LLKRDTGKNGTLLRTPRLLDAESHKYISVEIESVLKVRHSAFGEGGCPVALVTDNILRDKCMMTRLLTQYFPAAMSRTETQPVLCQDIIHRQWHITRVLPKSHPDYGAALADIKAIFGRLT
jgi:hypothetical protein